MSEKYFPLKDEAWEDEMYSEIHVGDTVWYRDSSGAVSKGRAMLRGPAGWVINIGDGRPQVVNEGHNYCGHTPGKGREPDHLGHFLNKISND